MTRYTIRLLEFEGQREYPQGYGMQWDPIDVDLDEDEQIVEIKNDYTGGSFNYLKPVTRVWIAKKVTA